MTIPGPATDGSGWAQRVGTVSARWLTSAARFRIAGAVAAVAALALLGLSIAAERRLGESLPFALILSFATVAAIVAFSMFFVSVQLRWPAIDTAYDYLQQRIRGLTGREVRRALRSLGRFDATLAPRVGEPGAAPSETPWQVGTPRPILRGISQRRFRSIELIVLAAGFLFGMSLAFVGATGHFPPLGLWTRLWSIAGGIVGVGILMAIGTAIRREQEFRAGYSTVWAVLPVRSPVATQDIRRCVDLVDNRSGMLIRGAGQPPISRGTYLNRRNEVRERFPEARPARL